MTAKAQPRDSLYQRFRQQVAQHPNNIAICDGQQSFTYQQLEQQVQLAAQNLYTTGVRAATNVALLLNRDCELIIQILATLRLGACYVPIDPDYPQERINWIINASAPAVLVTHKQLSQELWGPRHQLMTEYKLLFVEEQHQATHRPPEVEPLLTTSDSFAYIIFTSGTTGNPKGVAVGHQQVLALLDSAIPMLEATHTDVWTLFHSLAFDFSVWELWGALTTGAKLTIVPKSVAWSADAFVDFLRLEQVTILNQTPSAFYALIEAELSAQQQNKHTLLLRKVIFGGEALDLQKVKKWWQLYAHNQPELINMYGITETTVHVTWLSVNNELADTNESPIGKSLPSLETLLLNEKLQKVADGDIGEIYVAGTQLAYGYLGRPDLTATRFIASPFHPGQRLYRSGDLAKRQNGQLYYLGRADRQLKIRGFRIEPAEIEAVLECHPAIQRAVILAKPSEDNSLPDALLAFLQGPEHNKNLVPSSTELRTFAAEQLPNHYLPEDFIFVDTLPLTLNGKLDQTQLIEKWQNKQTSSCSVNHKRLQLLRARQLHSRHKSPA